MGVSHNVSPLVISGQGRSPSELMIDAAGDTIALTNAGDNMTSALFVATLCLFLLGVWALCLAFTAAIVDETAAIVKANK